MDAVLIPELGLDPAYEPRGWKGGRNFYLTPIDNTSDDADQEFAAALADARARHRRDFNANELSDVCHDDDLLELWKFGKGDATVLGLKLLDLIEERIESNAQYAAGDARRSA